MPNFLMGIFCFKPIYKNMNMTYIGKKEIAYLNAAKSVATLSDHRVKVGSVLVKGHKIIGSGYNSNSRTDKLQADLDKAEFGMDAVGKLHSEADCLIPFIKRHIDISGSTLYIYREKADGSLGICRPCNRCMRLIKMAGIKKICYTTNDGIAREALFW